MTTTAPSILCPVDFSDASRSALRHAAALADHFAARLIVLTVDDPLLSSVAAQSGLVPSLAAESRRELYRFIEETLAVAPPVARATNVRVEAGKPADEILRVARDEEVELIVMSSHGRSGVGKRFFGSTTERVLRSTSLPVLVTPKDARPAGSLRDLASRLHRIVVPVDLSEASPRQVRIAAGIASTLAVPLLLAHVLEPIALPPHVRALIPGIDAERRADTEKQLIELARTHAHAAVVETLPLSGDPSDEIVKLAGARDGGLIVMGLHSSGLLGPRMGAVTYRVLCQTTSLVLALPPEPAATGRTGRRLEGSVLCL